MPEADHDKAQDALWERRARTSKRSGEQTQEKSPILIAPAQFKQQLLKYCQRQTKHDRTFCLVSVRILEYPQVVREFSEHAGDQLNKLFQDVCLKFLRDADRVTMPRPGRFLVLLPDTDYEGAQQGVSRIASTVASTRLHYKQKPLHASCSLKIADSAQFGTDAQALLAELGYEFAEDGKLTETAAHEAAVMHATPFAGAFEVWLSRYEREPWNQEVVRREELEAPGIKVEQFEAIDQWRLRGPVVIQKVSVDSSTEYGAEQLETIFKRGRTVQHLDHPCITTIIDYHVQDWRSLYLVREKLTVAEPSIYIADDSPGISVTLDWLVQISNALIYMQGLMPPLVPPLLDECLYIDVSKRAPIIVDYELPYLLPDFYAAASVSEQEAEAASQGRPVAAYRPAIDSIVNFMELVQNTCGSSCKELSKLITRLRVSELPKELNTIFKVRAALVEALESEKQINA